LHALDEFAIDVDGRDALDVGASTGGFTQVLLEAGARRVLALDVGRGQLDWTLRNDARVLPLEGINARHLTPADLPFVPSLAVIDVSFISLELVLSPVWACLSPGGDVVALIKPQFEVGRGQVGKGGIVRDPDLHRQVLQKISGWVRSNGRGVAGLCASPLRGADGNREFLIHIPAAKPGLRGEALDRALTRALAAKEENAP
jgi:23S rRNA (cytidine1920-2'-O)/16S rRNA (cytidine1409-2'-O)-methyltransferase